jgi:hypothetical protein
MMILDTNSLMNTVDNVNDCFMNDISIPQEEGLEAARWIVTRKGEKGAYRGMFAPTQRDFEHGIRVFTGERLTSASARHIMGQEAARAAWLLGSQDPVICTAYDQATKWMNQASDFQQTGTFCCGKCSLAFWRHYKVGNFKNQEALLSKGLSIMKTYRSGDGKWHRFPFFYAIYTLQELGVEEARAELKYAQPVMEKYLHRTPKDIYAQRKYSIIEKVLNYIN